MQKTVEIPLTRGQVALIDEGDFPLVSGRKWYALPSTVKGRFYAMSGAKRADGKTTMVSMHRLITGAPKGKEVDHVNHDTLDNRRENLRVGSHRDNMQNGRWALATHCPKGHPYDEANTYRMKHKNGRQCRECARLFTRAALARETPEQKADREAKKKAFYEKNIIEQRAKRKAYEAAHKEEAKARMDRWRAKQKLKA
jgi:hypothetical protein